MKELFEQCFNMKVRQRSIFCERDWIFIDKPPNSMKEKTDVVAQDPSMNLVPRKDGPFRVLQVGNHMVTVNVNGIRIVISINRTTLARTAKKAMQATEVERHDEVPLEACNTNDEYVA